MGADQFPGKTLVGQKELFLFTVDFPYGNYEASFLPQELNILKDFFQKIYLVPLYALEKKLITVLPGNVEVLDLSSRQNDRKKPGDYLEAGKFFLEELFLSKNIKLIRNFKYHLSELMVYSALSKNINSFLDKRKIDLEQVLFYTYWFDGWSSALMILKKKYLSGGCIITRAHGFDLYENRNKNGYIFPRFLQIKYTDTIYAISNDGASHLKSKFPEAKNKINISRLGITKTFRETPENKSKDGFLMVSCSAVIDLKRVHKIVEILMHCQKKIHWMHFGDGPLLEGVKELAKKLPKQVKADFRGNVNNQTIKEFYSENYVDWFINVSEYEGIPVSIMEAISFGIPAIATNVGGMREIVTETTGILIDKDFDPKHVMSIIENKTFSDSQRSNVIDFWKKNYDADTNFKKFAEDILQLNIKALAN